MKSKLETFKNYELSKLQTLAIYAGNMGGGCLIPCIMEYKKVALKESHKWMIDTCKTMHNNQ